MSELDRTRKLGVQYDLHVEEATWESRDTRHYRMMPRHACVVQMITLGAYGIEQVRGLYAIRDVTESVYECDFTRPGAMLAAIYDTNGVRLGKPHDRDCDDTEFVPFEDPPTRW